MHVIVCVKQVPDPEVPPAKFKIDPATKKVVPPPGIPPVISVFDERAVELACRLKEKYQAKITAITMRKDPIYHAILSGMPMTDNHWLKKYSLAAGVYREIVKLVPYPEDIRGINISDAGTGFTAVVSIYKRSERTPMDIIYTLLSSHMLLKNVIVVDDDIDPYDLPEVTRAWTTRLIPGRDIIIPPAPGVDYATQGNRLGMNATAEIKNKKWMIEKAVPPGVDQVDYV